jgi:hypothetical protein
MDLMSLKDALSNTKRKEQEISALEERRPRLVEEWRTAVTDLFKQIREDLKEYEADGSIHFSEHHLELTEPPLGTYRIGALTLTAGQTKIMIEPRGLLYAVWGEVGMYRHGRENGRHRIALLRAPPTRTNPTPCWVTSPPLDTSIRTVERLVDLPHAVQRVVMLDKQVLEYHLERLLKGA